MKKKKRYESVQEYLIRANFIEENQKKLLDFNIKSTRDGCYNKGGECFSGLLIQKNFIFLLLDIAHQDTRIYIFQKKGKIIAQKYIPIFNEQDALSTILRWYYEYDK